MKAKTDPFDGLYSLADAASLWGVDESTLRHAIRDGRIYEGEEVKKFGKQWIITREAMERRYGELKTP